MISIRLEITSRANAIYDCTRVASSYHESGAWRVLPVKHSRSVEGILIPYMDARSLESHVSDAFCSLAGYRELTIKGEIVVIVNDARRWVSFIHLTQHTALAWYPVLSSLALEYPEIKRAFPSLPDALFKAAYELDVGVLMMFKVLNA